jgi:hypothetical protein
VDDLKFVAIVERSLSPAIPRHDVSIQFDGDAVGLHAERFHEGGEGGNRGIEYSFFSVNVESHDV